MPADALAKQLADALPPGTLVVSDRRSATVIVTGTAPSVERATQLLGVLDRPSDTQSQTFPLRYLRRSKPRGTPGDGRDRSPASLYPVEQQNDPRQRSRDFIARVAQLVARIDRPGQQVRYEVRVTDISPSDSSNVGILFGAYRLAVNR